LQRAAGTPGGGAVTVAELLAEDRVPVKRHGESGKVTAGWRMVTCLDLQPG
jgi:hypothetical protein